MAKDKERSVNPAQQQRKLEKAKALKKSKADLQNKRNEKLARRNPDRIQRQIDDLKALETAGDIKPRERAILADLERDLKAVKKAKESLGGTSSAQPSHFRSERDTSNAVLGKRRHDGQRKQDSRRDSSGSDTDDSVRNIPWPRDTPPPVPREFRRSKYEPGKAQPSTSTVESAQPRTTYESAPQIRDLKKEAVNKFVPNAVKRKQEALKGHSGQLLEPEEMDKLEQEGYLRSNATNQHDSKSPQNVESEELRRLRAEEEAFERELAIQETASSTNIPHRERDGVNIEGSGARFPQSRQVEVEEIEDEDL